MKTIFWGSFWMRFFHAPTLPAVSRKRKGASGLRAHQQQLGINQVFECFSTLLAKMRIVKGIGALGREIPSCQASASISSTWRTAGLDNKNPRCNWGPMQLKHQNDFQSQNLKSIQPTSPKLFISFEGSWLSAAITSQAGHWSLWNQKAKWLEIIPSTTCCSLAARSTSKLSG